VFGDGLESTTGLVIKLRAAGSRVGTEERIESEPETELTEALNKDFSLRSHSF
jgi:hypothetical protein